MPNDPVQVDAGFQLKNLATSGAWSQYTLGTFTGDVNDLTLVPGPSGPTLYRISSTLAVTLSGILAPAGPSPVVLVNVGSFAVIVLNDSALSLSANRFQLSPPDGMVVLRPLAVMMLFYVFTLSRWVVLFAGNELQAKGDILVFDGVLQTPVGFPLGGAPDGYVLSAAAAADTGLAWLPGAAAADTRWLNFPPWNNPNGLSNDLDITSLPGLSPGLVAPTVTFNANVPNPRILYSVGNNYTSILTGVDTSIGGVVDYPIVIAGGYITYFRGGGVTLANQYGTMADAYGTAVVPAGSAINNQLNIRGLLPPFTATVNLNSTTTVIVTGIPSGFTITSNMLVFGTGIPAATKVVSVVGATVTISNSASITSSGVTIYLVSTVMVGNGAMAVLIPIPQGSRGGGDPLAYGGWNVLLTGGSVGQYP